MLVSAGRPPVLASGGGDTGNAHGYLGTASQFTGHRQRAAVRLGDTSAQVKAETQTPGGTASGRISPVERLRHARQIVSTHAPAVIANRDLDFGAARADSDLHRSS